MIELPPNAPAAIVAPCEVRILVHRARRETPERSWRLSRERPGGGAVTLFGAEHLRDPAAPPFAAPALACAPAK